MTVLNHLSLDVNLRDDGSAELVCDLCQGASIMNIASGPTVPEIIDAGYRHLLRQHPGILAQAMRDAQLKEAS